MIKLRDIFYRPPENHLGVIYCRDRFSRFVTPDQWALVQPFRHVHKEICLEPRTVESNLEHVFTSDQVTLTVHIKTFFRVDPRLANRDQVLQVLHFPDEAWPTIVKTNLEEIVRNQVFISRTCDELFTHHGRQELRQALSGAIAERVRGFGVMINPLYGVAISNLQPNTTYLKALEEQSAAAAQSEAAVRRILPMVERLTQDNLPDALQAVYLQIAAAIAKEGQMPEVFLPGAVDLPAGLPVHRPRRPARPDQHPIVVWPGTPPYSD